MADPSDVIVSVRIPKANLHKLQLLAEVYDQSVGALIRAAVEKHVKEIAHTDEFRKKATEMQRRYDETLSKLLRSTMRISRRGQSSTRKQDKHK